MHNPDYDAVTIVVRRDPGLHHPKLRTLVGDAASLSSLRDEIGTDDVFICLGTTKKKTPDRAEYYRIDHDYVVDAARLAKERGARSAFLVSSVGSDANSSVFYLRTKGEAERDVIALGFKHTHIFRPSVIMGEREEHRPGEKALIALWAMLNPLLMGSLSRYRGMDARDIARAMNRAAEQDAGKVTVYHWREMRNLL